METRNGNLQTFVAAENRWRSIYYLGSDSDFGNAANYDRNPTGVRKSARFVKLSGDGKTLFGASHWQTHPGEARVYAWDVATRKTKFVVAVPGVNDAQVTMEPSNIDVSRDGKTLVFVGSDGLQLVDLTGPWKAGEHDPFHLTRVYGARSLPFEGRVLALALAPNAKTLAVFTDAGLGLFDMTTRQLLTRVQSLGEAAPLSLDTTRPARDDATRFGEFKNKSGFGSFLTRESCLMKWSSDDQFLAVTRDNALWLLSANGQLQARATTRVMPGRDTVPAQNLLDSDQSWPPVSLDWAPDDRALAVGGVTVELWSAPALKFLQTLPATAPAAFLPDGSLVTPKPDDAPQFRLLKWRIEKP